jgi:CO dehydrogenase/acetyl-CoA synthase alpha subunit
MIRKRGYAAIEQGQMIVVQYPEGFETRGVALGGSCTLR